MSKTGNVQKLQAAFSFHQSGNLNKAADIYREIIHAEPRNFQALHYLGVIEAGSGNLEQAKSLMARSLAIQPSNVQFAENYAAILFQLGEYESALKNCQQALQRNQTNVSLLYVSAISLFKLNRFRESIVEFNKLLTIQPNNVAALNERSSVLVEMKEYDAALASIEGALKFQPQYAEAHLNKGNLLSVLRRYVEALAAYDQVLAIRPSLADAWRGRGNVLSALDRFDEALAAYDRTLALSPDSANAWLGRGNLLYKLSRYDDALAAYDKALQLNPALDYARLGRGNIFYERNLSDKAIAEFRCAVDQNPRFAEGRFAACFAELPILYNHEEEIALRRGAYEKTLRDLNDDIEAGKVPGDLGKAIGLNLPFYLAYQQYNDRDLQRLYGSMICRIVERMYSAAELPPPPSSGEKIRVGIVSGFFNMHSNWKIPIKGWISQIDRSRFEIFGYHTGSKRDAETAVAKTLCGRFVDRDMIVSDWRREILSDAPHVLIYPGLFMDEISVQLAAQRLARVQCVSWGHPETSGMPTLDYFLSSDAMEPPQAAEHYTEKLIRLPNLSIYYEQGEVVQGTLGRTDYGLRTDAIVFWCGQSLYKFLPQFDDVFARIAEQVGNCQFVFLQHQAAPEITQLFKGRLSRAFAAQGLKASDYVQVLPSLRQNQFGAAIGQCDVFLDSIGWSGCNSTLESLPQNIPIVTMTGSLMRGCHTAAILRMMETTDTIVNSVEEYIAAAVRLAKSPEERHALRRKIEANKHRVYRDRECIDALERFLDHAVHQQV